ncbi:MAG: DUF1998 domain-containing protein [Planctomycetes bacterium]|nr:DUF1998 domain-containing protein [Planctomycetota bacterium]
MARNNELGEIRRSQVVTTYGPGAIVDFRAGSQGDAAISAVAAGLEAWQKVPDQYADATRIHEPRLQKLLNVKHFRLAPVAPRDKWKHSNKPASVFLEGRRFPLWQQCPRCHRLATASEWSSEPGDPALRCGSCSSNHAPVHVVPVRFVAACPRGHLEDFPWHWWVQHSESCKRRELYLDSKGGTGLASLILRCGGCNRSRSMDGALLKRALKGTSCRGNRPWLDDSEECAEDLRGLQRGASNLYFAAQASSLDIPPWSQPLVRMLGKRLDSLLQRDVDERRKALEFLDEGDRFSVRLGMTLDEVLDRIEMLGTVLDKTSADALRREEYEQLRTEHEGVDPDHEFEVRVQPRPDVLVKYLEALVEVRRLREVRALRGFTRISPPGPDEAKRPLSPLSRQPLDWLPAVEVRGEGIFVGLDLHRVREWEHAARDSLAALTSEIERRYTAAWSARGDGGEPVERPITPRFLLVHSLAHALIRQLALDCGYSSASLRERLYVAEDDHEMAGLLIYTASSDADGTLGGLSRQARPERFAQLLIDAIRSIAWCSNDPLCIHGRASSEPLNRAACHACILASETSCEQFNQLLDRTVLLGAPGDRKVGFFARLL